VGTRTENIYGFFEDINSSVDWNDWGKLGNLLSPRTANPIFIQQALWFKLAWAKSSFVADDNLIRHLRYLILRLTFKPSAKWAWACSCTWYLRRIRQDAFLSPTVTELHLLHVITTRIAKHQCNFQVIYTLCTKRAPSLLSFLNTLSSLWQSTVQGLHCYLLFCMNTLITLYLLL
jgi:hypothetical protein